MRTLALLAIAPLVLLAGCGDSGSDGTTVDAVVNVSPPAGTVITDFVFDASGSTTGSRDLEFRWDWNGDGTWDTDWSADALVSHRFAEGGSLSVYIEVTDGSDSDIATVPVLVDAAHGAMQTLFSFPASASPRDLAYDGSHIWITNWNLPTYKLTRSRGTRSDDSRKQRVDRRHHVGRHVPLDRGKRWRDEDLQAGTRRTETFSTASWSSTAPTRQGSTGTGACSTTELGRD